MKPFAYLSAKSVEQAARRVARGGGRALLKAGGIDMLDLLKEGLAAPDLLVSIHAVPGLAEIREQADGGMALGPLCTLHALATSLALRRRYPALVDAAGGAATPQIRRVATLGGNLHQRPRCWYFRSADLVCLKKGGPVCFAQEGENRFHAIFGNGTCAIVHPSAAAVALVAYGATLVVAAGKQERRVAVEDHFVRPEEDIRREHRLEPGEVVTSVLLPAAPTRSAYLKVKERRSFDWPLADVAVALRVGDDRRCASARIVLGSAAPTPWRAREAEEVLAGKAVDAALAEKAGAAAVQGARPLAGNGYKVQLFRVLVRRAILRAMEVGG